MGMIEMKIPFSTVISFLVSAPITNFVIVTLIMGMFGWKVALLYFLWTFAAAILAGYILGNSPIKYDVKTINFNPQNEACATQITETPTSSINEHNPIQEGCFACSISDTSADSAKAATTKVDFWAQQRPRIADAMEFAKIIFKMVFPYALAGSLISGFAAAFLPASIVEQYVGNDNVFAIPFMAAIGVPLYLRIEMAMPLLSILLAKGMGLGAAMALLMGGTGASLPELAILSAMLKPRAVAVYAFYVFLVAMIGGYLFQYFI